MRPAEGPTTGRPTSPAGQAIGQASTVDVGVGSGSGFRRAKRANRHENGTNLMFVPPQRLLAAPRSHIEARWPAGQLAQYVACPVFPCLPVAIRQCDHAAMSATEKTNCRKGPAQGEVWDFKQTLPLSPLMEPKELRTCQDLRVKKATRWKRVVREPFYTVEYTGGAWDCGVRGKRGRGDRRALAKKGNAAWETPIGNLSIA